jgi:adiponectin receptor
MCRLYKYDYAGVSVMIACSVYPPYIYGFLCGQMVHWAYFYTSFINISSIMLVVVCVHPNFDNNEYRKLRTVLYCVVGLSCGLPGFHYLIADLTYVSYCNLYLWGLGGFFFVFGAFIYFKRFPERKYPGRFDYFGQSHNIWHFFVLLGGITHFFASLANYYGRRAKVCPVI